MRKTALVLFAASLAAAMPLLAAPVTSDGIMRMGDVALDALSRKQARDGLAADFAATGNYGALLQQGASLLASQAQDRQTRHLVAAALAASGQDDKARDLLLGTDPQPDESWGLIARALLARQAGDLPAAGVAAQAAIAADPKNAYTRNVAGTIAAMEGDLQAAANHFAAAVERGPEGVPFLANLGAVLAELGDAPRATQALDLALQLAPDNCSALIATATLRPVEAPALLTRCLDAEPSHPTAANRLVEAWLAQGDVDAARKVLTRHGDGITDPDLARARIALHAGDGPAAEAALANIPDSPQRALLQALAAAMSGDMDKAVDLARQAEEADPSRLVALGLTVARGGKPDPDSLSDHPLAQFFAALADLGQAPDQASLAAFVSMGDALPGLRFEGLAPADLAPLRDDKVRQPLVLAMMFESAKLPQPSRDAYAATAAVGDGVLIQFLQARSLAPVDRGAAMTVLDEVLVHAPDFAAAHRLKADLLAREGQSGPALDHLALALAVHEDAEGRLMQGVLAENAGRMDLAGTAYERCVALAPESFAGLNQLAWFLARQQTDLDRALSLAERADTLQPGNASILDTKGWIQFLTGRTEDAVATLRAAHGADGGRRPEIALHLARAEAAAGNLPRAAELLEAIAGSGPDPVKTEAAALLAKIGRG